MDGQKLREAAARDQERAARVDQLPAHVLELAYHDADIERLAGPV